MQSALPKVLHQVAGRSMLGHVLAVADTLGAANTVVVLAEDTIEPVRATFGPRYHYVTQRERLGTGHALLQAQPLVANQPGDVLVLYGDSPLLQAATAQRLLAARREQSALLALLSFQADPPTGYGRVLRDANQQVLALIEERNATSEQKAIREANSGFMAFDGAWLWQALPQVPRNPLNGEYYLTDVVAMAVEAGGAGSAIAVDTPDQREAWGCNDRVQLAQAEQVLRERITSRLMRTGVTITDPAATYIDVDVQIGRDTILLPGTRLTAATTIGERCMIGPYTTISDSSIGNDAIVRYAMVEHATIAAGSTVGPFVQVRGEAAIAYGSK